MVHFNDVDGETILWKDVNTKQTKGKGTSNEICTALKSVFPVLI